MSWAVVYNMIVYNYLLWNSKEEQFSSSVETMTLGKKANKLWSLFID